MDNRIAGVRIPDGPVARAAVATVLAEMPEILYRHAMRVFLFASIIGLRRKLVFDSELLYVAALFHDMGLTERYRHSRKRFEVDGANAVHTFLDESGVSPEHTADAWHAIALHTTPGIHPHMTPLTALLGAGVETDLMGLHFHEISRAERDEILQAWPRGAGFKELILEALSNGIAERPATAFGNVCADVLERFDPNYCRTNFCGLVLGSSWKD
ncbi:HD domain-containing protein [Burkholderia catarinensis]|uniref:HD domain-containing protein n=1 Tax=Burkholderia catarinensis TaxID=1108140 RepID=UPI00091AB0B7|nr:HD domain-containing protein [Burkholderia catarinensis]KAG8153767.1 phosphohydrolase [Burkholderia catarinensis]